MAAKSQAVQSTLARLKAQGGTSFKEGTAALEGLGETNNISAEQIAEVTFKKGDKVKFPATQKEFDEIHTSTVLGNKPVVCMVLDTVGGRGSKVLYYTSLRKTLIPAEQDPITKEIVLHPEDAKHGGDNSTYKDVISKPTMKEVYQFIVDNKLGKEVECIDILSADIATYKDGVPVGIKKDAKCAIFKW